MISFGVTSQAFAADYYWVGSYYGDGSYGDSGNWSATSGNACGANGGAGVPGASDTAHFTNDCTTTVNINGNWTVAGLDVAGGYGGTLDLNAILQINGSFTSSGGYFNHNNNLVRICAGTTDITFNSTWAFDDLEFCRSADTSSKKTVTLAVNPNITGYLKAENTATSTGDNSLEIGGSITVNSYGGYEFDGASTELVEIASSLTLTSSMGTYTLTDPNVHIYAPITTTTTIYLNTAGALHNIHNGLTIPTNTTLSLMGDSAILGDLTVGGTVSIGNYTLYVGNNTTPGATTFVGGNFTLQSGGTFTSGATGILRVTDGNFTVDSGSTFTHGNGTIEFYMTDTDHSIDPGGKTFYDVDFHHQNTTGGDGIKIHTITSNFYAAGSVVMDSNQVLGSPQAYKVCGSGNPTITIDGNLTFNEPTSPWENLYWGCGGFGTHTVGGTITNNQVPWCIYLDEPLLLYVTTGVDEYNSDGDCSFREALNTFNTNSQTDNCNLSSDGTIRFSIDTGDPSYDSGNAKFDIDLATTLSSIATPLTLDGSDQDGAVCGAESPVVKIYLDATNASGTYTNGVATTVGNLILNCITITTSNIDGGTPDTAAPTVSIYSPADNATDVAVSTDLVLTFNESIVKGTGNIVIKEGATTIETIAVTSGSVVIAGNTATINPTSDLSGSTSYHIEIAATAFEDLSGNAYAGISNSTTWNFTTGAGSVATSAKTPSAIYGGSGSYVWTGTVSTVQTDDTSAAQFDFSSCTNPSADLTLTDFGFTTSDVPSGSTINGITVSVIRKNNGGAYDITDSTVKLINGAGTVVGSNKALGSAWSTATNGETVVYGGAADTWSASLTDADVIDTDFGILIVADDSYSCYDTAEIDYVTVTINYTAP